MTNTCTMLTPVGRGAVAVVAVMGPAAAMTLDRLFSSASKLKFAGTIPARQSTRRICYGIWNSTGEDVVVIQMQDEHFEVHCHGGHSAPDSILQSLTENGFQELDRAAGGERIHSNRWSAEIAIALSQTPTEKTAKLLLQQFGIVDTQLKELTKLLNDNPVAAVDKIETMLTWANFGLHLTQPWSVVFCGRPNVGKSSLVNEIVGFNRVIVHETAGTTRDVVSATTAVHGWPIEIKDTAGLRESENEIEKKGILLTEAQIQTADLVVAIFDASDPESRLLHEAMSRWKADAATLLVVFNKADLINESDPNDRREFPKRENAISTSAATGAGLPGLVDSIASCLVRQLPPTELLIPISPAQCERLKKVRDLIEAKEPGLASQTLAGDG